MGGLWSDRAQGLGVPGAGGGRLAAPRELDGRRAHDGRARLHPAGVATSGTAIRTEIDHNGNKITA
jgi:hypothetical protein